MSTLAELWLILGAPLGMLAGYWLRSREETVVVIAPGAGIEMKEVGRSEHLQRAQ